MFLKYFKLILVAFVTILILGCGNNLHYTAALNTLSVNLILPPSLVVGQSVVLSGSCFPNGASNINITSAPSGDFAPVALTCDCVNNLILNCVDSLTNPVTNIIFSGTGPNGGQPSVVSTVTDLSNGTNVSQINSPTILPTVDLTGPTSALAGGPSAAFMPLGTCSYAGVSPTASVTISDVSNSMTPSTLNCVCNGPGVGVLNCSAAPNVNFTSENSNFLVTINDGSSTSTDPSNVVAVILPIINLNTPPSGPFSVGDLIQLQGTCESLNDNISVPNPAPANLSPAGPRNCQCGLPVIGQFDCGSYTLTNAGVMPTFVAMVTDLDSETATDSESVTTVSPNLSVALSLSLINGIGASPGDGIYSNQILTFTILASNSGTGNATSVQLNDLCPTNTTTNGVFTAGVGTYNTGTGLWSIPTITSGGGSSTLTFECVVNLGLSSGAIANAVTTISSFQTGSVALSGVNTTNPILAPTVDLTTGPINPTPRVLTALPANMGSCTPASTPSSVTVTNLNSSMSPSTITCNCNSAGQINCSSNSVTFTSTDAPLAATITANGVGPVADSNSLNDPSVVVSPTLTLIDPGLGPYGPSSNILISGACESAGSSITVTPTPSTDLNPASVTCLCGGGPGSYSCPNFVVNPSGANSTITFNSVITDQDPTGPETASASMQENIAFGVQPTALVSNITPNSDSTLQCLGIPNGFSNSASTYDPACNTSALQSVRYRIFLRLNSGPQNLIASYPSASTFNLETAAFTAPGASGTYGAVTVSNWNTFSGVTLAYNDEICVSNIARNCAAGGNLVSTESAQVCTKWFGRQAFAFTGTNQLPAIPTPVPTQIYGKLWAAAGGAGTADADVRKTQGGSGGFTSYKGAFNSSMFVVVGRGGLGGVITAGGAATFGGGGAGGSGLTGRGGAGSGGGLSGFFVSTFTQGNSLAIAGGGGAGAVGSGSTLTGNGGSGGGSSGGSGSFQNSAINGGKGGTQLAGGATTVPSNGSTAGSVLQGGLGGTSNQGSGGGGGGYFGGGGGGGDGFSDKGGGGGSGFLLGGAGICKTFSTPAATSVTYSVSGTAGTSPANITDPDYNGTAGVSRYATAGTSGHVVLYYIP